MDLPPPAYDERDTVVVISPDHKLDMLQTQIDELIRERNDRLEQEERNAALREEELAEKERIAAEQRALDDAKAQLTADHQMSRRMPCCILPGQRLVIAISDRKQRLQYVDSFICFKNKRMDRVSVCKFTIIWTVLCFGWVLALVFAGIQTRSVFSRYEEYHWTEIPLHSAEFNQTCTTRSCGGLCASAIVNHLKTVDLCTNGVDCDVPLLGTRTGWVILMIFLCVLYLIPMELTKSLVGIYRHCKHF